MAMDNKELTQKKLGEYVKYTVGILFLAFVGNLISLALLDTLNIELDFNPFYIIWGILAIILYLYLLNTKPIEYPQHTETSWGARSRYVGELCSFTFMAFLYTIGSLAVLGMLLNWILEIDISEIGNTYRLIFLAWGGWIVGLRLYYKDERRR